MSTTRVGRIVTHFLCTIVLALALLETGHAKEPTRYMVVVTGSELLEGAFPDGHTCFITRTLRPLGLQCVGSMTVGDEQAEIRSALAYASSRAELILVTGGLGPTDNDLTCEAISKFTGIAVREHPELLAEIARRFQTPVSDLRANLRRQTRVPVGGSYLKNAHGTAVGLVFETTRGAIVALPGPPRELQPMVKDQLVPYLSRRFGTRLPGSSLTVRFVGLGQSTIDARMKQHVPLPEGVVLASQFDGSRVDFTFSLPEANEENQAKLDDLKKRILAQFGESVYAMDKETSLEDVVVARLKQRNEKLALAEVESGGNVEAALSGARGAEAVLAGAYIAPDYQTLVRLAGICTHERNESTDLGHVRELADLLSRAACGQWVVVVGRREGGEAGLVHAAIRSPEGETSVRTLAVRGNDEASRARLTTQIADALRRRLGKE